MSSSGPPRVLMFSTRESHPSVSRCHIVEFEEVVRAHDDVALLPGRLATPAIPVPVRRALGAVGAQATMSPRPVRQQVDGRYPLLVAFVQNAGELLGLEAVTGWRERCDRAVAFVSDLWEKDLVHEETLRRALSPFDDVFLLASGSIERVRRLLPSSRVHFLAPAVDAWAASPDPHWPERVIDVYYMGRRSPRAHRAFFDWAERRGRFYLHDTFGPGRPIDPREHRALLRRLVQRTRFFVVNKGLANRAAEEKIQDEVPSRFPEGAAGGAILIGDPPQTPRLEELFGWKDAIIELPFDSEGGPALVEELEGQTDRLEAARRTNVSECLRRHDWIHRWRTILETIGMAPRAAATERVERMAALAGRIAGG